MSHENTFFAKADADKKLCRISDGTDVEMLLKTYDATSISALHR